MRARQFACPTVAVAHACLYELLVGAAVLAVAAKAVPPSEKKVRAINASAEPRLARVYFLKSGSFDY